MCDLCPICNKHPESMEHLFFQCEWTRVVWFGSPLQWSTLQETQISFFDWFVGKMTLLGAKDDEDGSLTGLFLNLLWSIWNARNQFVFEGRMIRPEIVISIVVERNMAFQAAKVAQKSQNLRIPTIQNDKWTPPNGDMLKINIDATTDMEMARGAVVVIVRDRNGDMLTSISKRIPCSSPLQAEARALLEALHLVEALNIQQVIICKNLVDCCFSKEAPWQIASDIHSIKTKLMSLPLVTIAWARKTANKVAHVAANLALSTYVSLPFTACLLFFSRGFRLFFLSFMCS